MKRFAACLVLAFSLSFPCLASAEPDGPEWASLAEVDVPIDLVDVFRRLATIDADNPDKIRALTPARWKAHQLSTLG